MTDTHVLIGDGDAATSILAGGSARFGDGDVSLRTGVPRFRIIGNASGDNYRVEVCHHLTRDGKTIEQEVDDFGSGGGAVDSGATVFSFVSDGPHVGELLIRIVETGGVSLDIESLGIEYDLDR